jgi:hypothetical protein
MRWLLLLGLPILVLAVFMFVELKREQYPKGTAPNGLKLDLLFSR